MICINHLHIFDDMSGVDKSFAECILLSYDTILIELLVYTRFNCFPIFAEDHFVILARISLKSSAFPENLTRKNSIFLIKFRVDKVFSDGKLLSVVCLPIPIKIVSLLFIADITITVK